MYLPEVHPGDDLRQILTADNLSAVFQAANRVNVNSSVSFGSNGSSCYANVYSSSHIHAGDVLALSNDSVFTEEFGKYAVKTETVQNSSSDNHQVLCIAAHDIGINEIGKAVVSGIAIGSVNVSDTSHQFAKVENGVLVSTDEEDAPIRLISAPATGSQLCVLMLGFGNGGELKKKGPFDSMLKRKTDDNDEETTTLRCFDSSVPNGEFAGRIYNGSLIFQVNVQEWTVTSPGLLFLDVTYDPESGYNALLGFDGALPVVEEGERHYILQLAEIYMTDSGIYRLGKSREPADVRITDRWVK